MRMFATAALAAVVFGAASVAYAADATGTIKSLDMSKDMITLDNGASYVAPKSAKLSDFKVGEKVTVSYTKAGDRMDATPRPSFSRNPSDRSAFVECEPPAKTGGLAWPLSRFNSNPGNLTKRARISWKALGL